MISGAVCSASKGIHALTDGVETLRNNETIFEPHLHHTTLFADRSPSDFGSWVAYSDLCSTC